VSNVTFILEKHAASSRRKESNMSKKIDYSAEEWKAISGAPVAAGLLITLSDASGPIGIAKEALAVGKAITESASGDAPEIVKAVAESVRSGGGRPEMPAMPGGGDRTQMKNALVGAIKTAVVAVAAKSQGEVEAYKTWLMSVASKVSQAAKEGGFFGVGGTQVSGDEQAALGQLAEVLGMNARPTPGRA
jgi:hypothetical protein